jgi:hypothetical protein
MHTKTKKNILRIGSSLLSNNKKNLLFSGVILGCSAILLNIFFISKKQQETLPPKDDITLFLENVMIREDGLFTLLGSKPMTLFDIAQTFPETEVEFKEAYEADKIFLEKCRTDPEHFHTDTMTLPEYREYHDQYVKNKYALRYRDHKKLWESWMCERGPISTPLYRLTSRKKFGLFVNIPNTLSVLKKYYTDFSQLTQTKFDVDTILDSIDDTESPFWNAVFKNHYLFGLIMGYGQKNSYLFNWSQQNSLAVNVTSLTRFKELSRLNQHINVIRKKNVTLHDLEVPYFVTFEIDNEVVERYSREREKIISFLQNKELIPFIQAQLSQ